MYFLSRLWRRWAASTDTGMAWGLIIPLAIVVVVLLISAIVSQILSRI